MLNVKTRYIRSSYNYKDGYKKEKVDMNQIFVDHFMENYYKFTEDDIKYYIKKGVDIEKIRIGPDMESVLHILGSYSAVSRFKLFLRYVNEVDHEEVLCGILYPSPLIWNTKPIKINQMNEILSFYFKKFGKVKIKNKKNTVYHVFNSMKKILNFCDSKTEAKIIKKFKKTKDILDRFIK